MRLALPAQGKIAMGPAGDLAKGESDIFITTPLLWYPQFKCKTLSKTNWQRRLSGQPAHARGQSKLCENWKNPAIRGISAESLESIIGEIHGCHFWLILKFIDELSRKS